MNAHRDDEYTKIASNLVHRIQVGKLGYFDGTDEVASALRLAHAVGKAESRKGKPDPEPPADFVPVPDPDEPVVVERFEGPPFLEGDFGLVGRTRR